MAVKLGVKMAECDEVVEIEAVGQAPSDGNSYPLCDMRLRA